MSQESGKKIKKQPERRCVGCGQSFLKKELIRVVRDPEGQVQLDFTGKKSGRGAYLCHNLQCFRRARKAHRFESGLECEIPSDLYDLLETEMERNGQST